jgi:hypothetical protein
MRMGGRAYFQMTIEIQEICAKMIRTRIKIAF